MKICNRNKLINLADRKDLRSDPFLIFTGRSRDGMVVRIDHNLMWGNPYIIGNDGTRGEVMKKYETYLRKKIARGELIKENFFLFKNVSLACWCSPKSCHGNVILKILAEFDD